MRHARDEFSLKDSVEFLTNSRLAEYLLEAKVWRGYCSVEYRKILVGANRSKFRSSGIHENPNFYGFVRDHLTTVIALVEDNSSSGIRLASKSIQLTERAHSNFKDAWVIAQQRFNGSHTGEKGQEYDGLT